MEQFFDKIATNDPSVTEVNIVGNLKYLSLNAEEKQQGLRQQGLRQQYSYYDSSNNQSTQAGRPLLGSL